MTELDLAIEALHQVALDQPARDRLHFVDTVLEAATNNSGAVLYNLYKELDKVNDVEFGRIPDSKGDLTKYVYYDHMMKCIEVLSGLEDADKLPSITRMNKLHNILLGHRDDFVFGYKRDIELLKTTYVTMVLELNAMIDFAISDYTKYLKLSFNDRNTGKFDRRESMLVAQTDTMIRLFESGSWNIILKAAKQTSAQMTQDQFVTIPAAEAFNFNVGNVATKFVQGLKSKQDEVSTKVTNGLFDSPRNAQRVAENKTLNSPFQFVLKMLENKSGNISPVKLVAALISLLLALRGSLFVFGRLTGSISNFARNQSALLKSTIGTNEDGELNGTKGQKRMIKFLDGIADLTDAKYKKAEAKAAKELAESNKENLGSKDIVVTNDPAISSGGVNFGL